MTRLVTILAAVSALAPAVLASPQFIPQKPVCSKPWEDYEVTDVSEPYYTKAEAVGGSSCPQGAGNTCQHQKGYEHSVGITQSVSGGITGALDIGKIFNIAASFGYEYSYVAHHLPNAHKSVSPPQWVRLH